MSSLLITIIAIALVAVLAAATIFYGGDVLVSQQSEAAAATMDAQASQIHAASIAYSVENGNTWPANVAVLAVNHRYLSALPVPPVNGMALAQASFDWVQSAHAGDSTEEGVGALPALDEKDQAFLETAPNGAMPATFKEAYNLSDADAKVLRTQLQQIEREPGGTETAAKVLQVMAAGKALQTAGRPSPMDYAWPVASTQDPKKRFILVPIKVNKGTCQAVNWESRRSMDIPEAFTVGNGLIQCYGDGANGAYSYIWLAPGADQAEVAALLTPGSAPAVDVCPNLAGDQASVPAGYELQFGRCLAQSPEVPWGDHMDAGPIGAVQVGQTGSRVVTVTNRSATAQNYLFFFGEWRIAGYMGDPEFFSVSENTCEGVEVAPGDACSFKATFAPLLPGSAVLGIWLTTQSGEIEEWGYVGATGTAGLLPTVPLTFNLGQPGGGRVDVNGRVDGTHVWGELPESGIYGWDADYVLMTFCPTTPEGEAVMAAVYNDGWRFNNRSTRTWLDPYELAADKHCLVGWDPIPVEGIFPLQIDTGHGYLTGTIVISRPPEEPTPTQTAGLDITEFQLTATVPESSVDYAHLRASEIWILDETAGGESTLEDLADAFDIEFWSREDQGYEAFYDDEGGMSGIGRDLLASRPNAQFTRMRAIENGTVLDAQKLSSVFTSAPWVTVDISGLPVWTEPTLGADSRLIGFWYVKDLARVYAISRNCTGDKVAYPVGALGPIGVAGYAYNNPPSSMPIQFGQSIPVSLTANARHRSVGQVSVGTLEGVLGGLPDGQALGTCIKAGNGNNLACREDNWSPDGTASTPAIPDTVSSLAHLASQGITVLVNAPAGCSCNMPIESMTTGTLTHEEQRRYVIPNYFSDGCWTGIANCNDGWSYVTDTERCPATTVTPPPADGGLTWGTWEPLMAFSTEGRCGTHTGDNGTNCQASHTACPQWNFIPSDGAYDGCVRRSCGHPEAAYVPGC